MSFPEKVFGRCEESGHVGSDVAVVDHPNAEVTYGAAGSGYPLVEFQGKFVCKPCKRRLENEAVSIESSHRHEREDAFRSRAGFQRP